MGAYSGAKKFFKKPLDQVAKNLAYKEDNILILSGDEETLRKDFPATYQNILSCKHHSDRRTPLAYAQDLVASWLVEDSFLDTFNRCGLEATLDGADNNRQILSESKTSASSDFSITHNGISRKLELMNDYTGFWAQYHRLHLRDSKYQNMEREHSLFLAVSMETKEFALFDFNEEVNAEYIKFHRPYGNKPAYELNITNDMMHFASGENICSEIIKHF